MALTSLVDMSAPDLVAAVLRAIAGSSHAPSSTSSTPQSPHTPPTLSANARSRTGSNKRLRTSVDDNGSSGRRDAATLEDLVLQALAVIQRETDPQKMPSSSSYPASDAYMHQLESTIADLRRQLAVKDKVIADLAAANHLLVAGPAHRQLPSEKTILAAADRSSVEWLDAWRRAQSNMLAFIIAQPDLCAHPHLRLPTITPSISLHRQLQFLRDTCNDLSRDGGHEPRDPLHAFVLGTDEPFIGTLQQLIADPVVWTPQIMSTILCKLQLHLSAMQAVRKDVTPPAVILVQPLLDQHIGVELERALHGTPFSGLDCVKVKNTISRAGVEGGRGHALGWLRVQYGPIDAPRSHLALWTMGPTRVTVWSADPVLPERVIRGLWAEMYAEQDVHYEAKVIRTPNSASDVCPALLHVALNFCKAPEQDSSTHAPPAILLDQYGAEAGCSWATWLIQEKLLHSAVLAAYAHPDCRPA